MMIRRSSATSASPIVETLDSGLFDLAPWGGATPLVKVGPVAACDVWLQLPLDWLNSDVYARVYGVTAGLRLPLSACALSVGELTDQDESTRTVLALRVRGTPCSAFELKIINNTELSFEGARAVMQVWSEPSGPIVHSFIFP